MNTQTYSKRTPNAQFNTVSDRSFLFFITAERSNNIVMPI